MPQPKKGIDLFFYQNVFNPISKKLCPIHPNIITLSNFIFTYLIAYNLLFEDNINKLLLFTLLRSILDCLDGSVARVCDLKSDLGALLDVLSDTIFIIIVGIISIYKIYPNNNILVFIIAFIMLYMLCQTINEILGKRNNNNMFSFGFDEFIHDNILLLTPLSLYIIKKLIDLYN